MLLSKMLGRWFNLHLFVGSLICALGLTCNSRASDTTRVFFIGNSFTFTGDVPGLVKGLALASGKNFYYEQHTPGGVSVGDIAQDTLAHWRNSNVFNTLRRGNWDFVVLQDNQGRFVLNYGTFPSSSKVIEGHIKIRDSMKRYSPCAHMLLFDGWAVQGALPPYGSSGTALINRIYANYKFLNDSMHEVIAPIGIAWKQSIATYPWVNLWSADSTHESLEGAYLTAAVLYANIFRTNPVPNSFTGGVDSVVAHNCRLLAWQAVSDSVVPTNFATINVPLTYVAGTLTTSGPWRTYQWYRNDTLIPGATDSSQAYVSGNCFYVVATDTNGCTSRSMPYCYTTSLEDEVLTQASTGIHMYPNPASSHLHISGIEKYGYVQLYNAQGQLCASYGVEGSGGSIDISLLPTGVYFIRIVNKGGIWSELLRVVR